MKQFIYLNAPVGAIALEQHMRGRLYEVSPTLLFDMFCVANYELQSKELNEICIHYPMSGDLIGGGAEILCSWREFSSVSEYLAYNQLTDREWIRWGVPLLQVLYAMNTAFPEIRSFSYTVDEEAGLFFRFSKENIY